ncbi:MAG TPA: hypothetical protein VKV74_11950 [Bryobacteraceae bacterium]|nr:hypothetical protein [Bryobacteraceae bacterium]
MKLQGMGLVCTGGVTHTFVARLPSVLGRLGPVKASSFRIARQISRTLRAGHAASHYSALEPCPIICVVVPDASLDRTLRDFVAQTPLHNSMVVVCESGRESGSLAPLKFTSARVASLHPVPESREGMFVAEGHPETVRAIRGLLAEDGRKLIELKCGAKPLFFAGLHFASPLLLPWIAAAVESFRASGLTRAEAVAVGEHLGARMLHRYAKAGERVWNRKIAATLRRALEDDLEAIRRVNPRLPELYEQGIRIALARF